MTVDQTTYTAFSKTYPEGRLYWRVQPIDGAGNKLTWSTPAEFTRTADRPAFDSPVNDGAGPTEPLRWFPANFAASYDVEVYKNADTTASSTNRVLNANSKQVAYSFSKPLPASAQSYVWRVRAVDVDRRKGAWTQWASFKVSRQAPTLGGTDGQVFGARDAVFEWEALPGAASYKFERRNSGATYSTDNVRTTNTAYAPTKVIASGSWRVTALDSAGATLGVSPWRDVTVTTPGTTTPPPTDTTPPKVIQKAPLTYAKRGSNFTARFSEPVKGVSGTTMRLFKGTTRVSARVTLSADKRTATLNPSRLMKRRAKYTLKLSSGIRDLAGNRLKATSWTVRVR